MTSDTAKILEAASHLPPQEKLLLVDQLIAELDIPDPAIEALWAETAQHRSTAIKRGKMSTKPLHKALSKYSQ